MDPSLPAKLYGDEVHIRQILINVITNGIKYTKKGSVVLSLGFRSKEKEQILMTYDVRDTGMGIRKENIPFLFDAFRRVDSNKTHAIEGTGLGLSIVKQLLDMMGGTICVDSVYGQGSVFHIEIPQRIVDETPVGEVSIRQGAFRESRPGQSSPGAGIPGESSFGQSDCLDEDRAEDGREQGPLKEASLSILAVDDTPMNLKVVKKLLRDTGAAVDLAASGVKALEMTAKNHYDVILMDHQMPEMDGIECLHRIRMQEGGMCGDSRIICLTANVGAEMEKMYQQEGFDGYLEKPVRGRDLEREIARLTSC